MKIIKIILIMMMLFSFTGCAKVVVDLPPLICGENEIEENGVCIIDEDKIPPLTCGENEIEENGVCVILDQDLEDIKLVLGATNDLLNYQISVSIVYIEEEVEYNYEIILKFDDNISLFEMDDQLIYYEHDDGEINQYTKQGESFVLEVVDEGSGYEFYQNLDPHWFSKTEGYYALDEDYVNEITSLIQTSFPDGEIDTFVVALGETYLDYFKFNITLEQQVYNLEFTFSAFDDIVLELPTV